MPRRFRRIAGPALAIGLVGCSYGDGVNVNVVAPDAGTAEYGQKSVDQMKTMYKDAPKDGASSGPVDPADKMRQMYGK